MYDELYDILRNLRKLSNHSDPLVRKTVERAIKNIEKIIKEQEKLKVLEMFL